MRYSIQSICAGKWDQIFAQIMPEVKQNTKHQPCPCCGGKDRFRLFEDWKESGGAICNQCDAGNGVSWIMRLTEKDFRGACSYANSIVNKSAAQWSVENSKVAQIQRRIKLKENQMLGEKALLEKHTKVSMLAHKHFSEAVVGLHPYLFRKQLPVLNSKLKGNELLIPLQDARNYMWNLQSIRADGTKRFYAGGRVKGLFSCVGGGLSSSGRVYIAEGWATAATICQVTGCTSLAAMNAGNLEHAAREVLTRYPSIELVIAGDDDRFTKGNPGRTKAIKAARAVGAGIVFPALCSKCTCSDFNDASKCSKADLEVGL